MTWLVKNYNYDREEKDQKLSLIHKGQIVDMKASLKGAGITENTMVHVHLDDVKANVEIKIDLSQRRSQDRVSDSDMPKPPKQGDSITPSMD